jgi:hypothetical protein
MMQMTPMVMLTSLSQLALRAMFESFQQDGAEAVQLIDVESSLAAELKVPRMINLFLQQGDAAYAMIEDASRKFISVHFQKVKERPPTIFFIQPAQTPLLMDPLLLEYLKPHIIQLTLSAVNLFEDLRKKRKQDRKLVSPLHRFFGMWDQETITRKNGGKYTMLNDEDCLKNIGAQLSAYTLKDFQAYHPYKTLTDAEQLRIFKSIIYHQLDVPIPINLKK